VSIQIHNITSDYLRKSSKFLSSCAVKFIQVIVLQIPLFEILKSNHNLRKAQFACMSMTGMRQYIF